MTSADSGADWAPHARAGGGPGAARAVAAGGTFVPPASRYATGTAGVTCAASRRARLAFARLSLNWRMHDRGGCSGRRAPYNPSAVATERNGAHGPRHGRADPGRRGPGVAAGRTMGSTGRTFSPGFFLALPRMHCDLSVQKRLRTCLTLHPTIFSLICCDSSMNSVPRS